MKKKIISLILLALLCLSLVPTALAEDLSAPVCLCEVPCVEGEFLADCPVCSAEGAQPTDCARYSDSKENKDADTGEATEENTDSVSPPEVPPAENAATPKASVLTTSDVQALIDALPAPESITAENRAEAEALLSGVDDAKLALSDDDLATLDFTRYEAAVVALNALDNIPDASEPQLYAAQEATQNSLAGLFSSGYTDIKLTENISGLTLGHSGGGSSTITLDLNGYKLSNSKISFQPTGGNLTLKIINGTIENTTISFTGGKGDISSGVTANGVTIAAYGATVTFSPTSGATNSITAQGSSSVTIGNGSFATVSGRDTSKVTITGGTFNNNFAINGSVDIRGGTFDCHASVYGGSVSGGTFNSSFQGSDVSVSGGTFKGTTTLSDSTVTGGSFAGLSAYGDYLYRILGSGYMFADKGTGAPIDAGPAKWLSNVKVVPGGFSLSVTPPTSNIVVGTSQTLTATPSGASGSVTYTWYSKQRNVEGSDYTKMDGETGNSITINHDTPDAYAYMVVARDSRGYTAAAEAYASYANFQINTAPTPKNDLSYTGSPQTLINQGYATLGATVYYSLSENSDFSTDLPQAENAGTYKVYYYAELNGSRTATQYVEATIAPCDPASYRAYVKFFGFTYGEYSVSQAPGIDGNKSTNPWDNGSAAVTYYWSRENSNENGTKWDENEINALDAGTYYIYAVFAETQNFKAYTTPAKKFAVSRATPDHGITAISNLTYNAQSQQLVIKEDLSSRGYTVQIDKSTSSSNPYTLGEDGLPYGKNAGTYYIHFIIPESANYHNRSGYIEVTISPKTITETTMQDITYGDTKLTDYNSNGIGYFPINAVSGIYSGDDITVSGTLGLALSNADINAGTKTMTVETSKVELSGEDKDNYEYKKPATVTLVIAPKLITISSVNIRNKTYDSTTTAEVRSIDFNGLVGSDSLNNYCTATAVFNFADPGKNIPVTVKVTLKDELPAKNYVLTSSQFSATANINQIEITGISGISVSKAYDGTTTAVANFENAVFEGLLPAHEGKLSAQASNGEFASRNVGTYDNVSVNNVELTGEAAKYYTLQSGLNITASGSITPKEVSVSQLRAEDKAYDGTVAAVIDCSEAEITGAIAGDDLSVASAMGVFVDKNVIADNSVSLSQITLTGADKDNYTLAAGSLSPLSAQILPRAVTLESESFSKPYDGHPLTNGTGGVSVTDTSMVAGESFDYSFSASQTAIGKTQNIFTASASATANTANYSLTCNYGTLTVTLPADFSSDADSLTPDTVNSADRDTIKKALEEVNTYLGMSPSDEELATLNEKKAHCENLLERIDEIERAEKAAATKSTSSGVDTVDESNLLLWLVLAVVSLAAVALLILAMRRRK